MTDQQITGLQSHLNHLLGEGFEATLYGDSNYYSLGRLFPSSGGYYQVDLIMMLLDRIEPMGILKDE